MLAAGTVEGYIREWVEDGVLPTEEFGSPALSRFNRTATEGMPGRDGRLKPVYEFFAVLDLTVFSLQIKIALTGNRSSHQ